MAECQSRLINQTKQQRDIAVYCKYFLTILVGIAVIAFTAQSNAELNANTVIAMGDIGTIKTNSSDDINQVKWSELTGEQRKVLAPLGKEWDTLRPWQREKMLDIAKEYSKMDVEKQARIQKRLIVWSRMTPFERENARKRYQQFHSLSADKKDELRKKWIEHQKLPEAEREKLRKESSEIYYDPDLD
jgi:hypothetical protein